MNPDELLPPQIGSMRDAQRSRLREAILEEIERGRIPRALPSARGQIGWRRRSHRRLVLVAVALLALVLAATGVAVGVDLLQRENTFDAIRERIPSEPKRQGERVVVASGAGWSLLAYRSDRGLCLDVATAQGSGGGCGFAVRGAPGSEDSHRLLSAQIGATSSSVYVTGVASAEVARVVVELGTGKFVDAELHVAPAKLAVTVKFFTARLATNVAGVGGSEIRSVHAYDAEGDELDERSL